MVALSRLADASGPPIALAPRVESILRELIADAEERLVVLEAKARETEGFKPADNSN
jgi:hypothetical protein